MNDSPYIATASGRKWHFLTAVPSDVYWPDVAEGLAKTNRFNGQIPGEPYSVAQHCVEGLRLVAPKHRPYWLLHDAHEAFIGDPSSPFKRAVRILCGGQDPIAMLQAKADDAIYRAAGLDWPLPASVAAEIKRADAIMLATEIRDLAPAGDFDEDLPEPGGWTVTPWPWRRAAAQFLAELDACLPRLMRGTVREMLQ